MDAKASEEIGKQVDEEGEEDGDEQDYDEPKSLVKADPDLKEDYVEPVDADDDEEY